MPEEKAEVTTDDPRNRLRHIGHMTSRALAESGTKYNLVLYLYFRTNTQKRIGVSKVSKYRKSLQIAWLLGEVKWAI